jgi:hypothetical protein
MRKNHVAHSLVLAIVTIVSLSGCIAPDTNVTTVWQKLGLPPHRLRDQIFNKSGNRPWLERKPRLLRIADEANLKSELKPLKVAAEIKQAEDLAPQKIKALKYIGSIGCSCYNKDGEIEAALLEALNDCTESVRMAAICAIKATSGNCACSSPCNDRPCCSKDIQKKLNEMAYGQDDDCCWKEPNEMIRTAAAQALQLCPPIIEEPKEPLPKPGVREGVEREGAGKDGDKKEGDNGDGAESDDPMGDEKKGDTEQDADAEEVGGVTQTTPYRLSDRTNARNASQSTDASDTDDQAQYMVNARVVTIDGPTQSIILQLDQDYSLTSNSHALIRAEEGEAEFTITNVEGKVVTAQIVQGTGEIMVYENMIVKLGLLAE